MTTYNTISNYKKMMSYEDKVSVKVVDFYTEREVVVFADNNFLTASEEDRNCIIHNNFLVEHIQQEYFEKLYNYLEDTECSVNFEDKDDLELFEQFSYRKNPNKFFINELDDTYIFADHFYNYCINNNDSNFFFELAKKCLGVMSDDNFQHIESNVKLSYSIL